MSNSIKDNNWELHQENTVFASLNAWFLKRHPYCRVIQINEATPGQNSYPLTITDLGCFNSPYGDYMIELMKEIITE